MGVDEMGSRRSGNKPIRYTVVLAINVKTHPIFAPVVDKV